MEKNPYNAKVLLNYLVKNDMRPVDLALVSNLTTKSIYFYLKTGRIGKLGAKKLKTASRGELDFGIEYQKKVRLSPPKFSRVGRIRRCTKILSFPLGAKIC